MLKRVVCWTIGGSLLLFVVWIFVSGYSFSECLSDYTRYYYHDDYYKCASESFIKNLAIIPLTTLFPYGHNMLI
jgi:hypothetical protein